jgi:hypothetical protein
MIHIKTLLKHIITLLYHLFFTVFEITGGNFTDEAIIDDPSPIIRVMALQRALAACHWHRVPRSQPGLAVWLAESTAWAGHRGRPDDTVTPALARVPCGGQSGAAAHPVAAPSQ